MEGLEERANGEMLSGLTQNFTAPRGFYPNLSHNWAKISLAGGEIEGGVSSGA